MFRVMVYPTPANKALGNKVQCFWVAATQRSFMSTQPVNAPEEESSMMLMLGKPGGGKGTISNKILKVGICTSVFVIGKFCAAKRSGLDSNETERLKTCFLVCLF